MEWWNIPIIAAGLLIGSYLGTALADWIKVRLGWMDPPIKKGKKRKSKRARS